MIVVRRLVPELERPFLAFMDGPGFDSQPQWLGCYCQEYLNTAVENASSNSEEKRAQACSRIRNQTMNGYLAFADESEDAPVIGWMSANKHNNYRLLPPVEDELTATVICISVQKEHQGKGIASALLEFAIKDLKSQGFKKVQAAPLANGEFHDWGYRGPLSLYQKYGFSVGPQIDTQHVLVIRNLDS